MRPTRAKRRDEAARILELLSWIKIKRSGAGLMRPVIDRREIGEDFLVTMGDSSVGSRQDGKAREESPMTKMVNYSTLLASVCVGAFVVAGIAQAQEVKNA